MLGHKLRELGLARARDAAKKYEWLGGERKQIVGDERVREAVAAGADEGVDVARGRRRHDEFVGFDYRSARPVRDERKLLSLGPVGPGLVLGDAPHDRLGIQTVTQLQPALGSLLDQAIPEAERGAIERAAVISA